MADIARLIQIIEPEARALGFELVRVKLTGSDDERTLQIMAEDPATGQLVVEQCAQLSRAVSDRIDALEEAGEELVEGAYNLEVSSPGIDRPLTREKDFANWAGHTARFNLLEPLDGRKRVTGELAGLEPRGAASCVGITVKDGATHFVPLSQIHSAQLVLTDRLIAATTPQDMAGVDDIEELNEEEEAQD